ncbi:MAG: DUF2179 domain-containing protein [Bacteroidales bacterium]
MDAFLDGATFTYIVLPLLIFLARVADVSIGTIRIVMVSKGHKFLAPILGFFEILILLMAISKIFENLDNWACFFGYALGFATGNYVGLCIEEKLAVGIVKLQIITRHNAEQLIENLINAGYGITHHDAQGSSETVSIIYSMIKRSEIKRMEEIIKSTNPKAFYSIEDVKAVKQGVFPASSPRFRWRKGK